mmetsp:Transcript_27510/g.77118  ORF Transcript_27510/g.77118 Transcript_27510/m.77118 type:complete len:323 (+) Transcript_27510:278-1246(+)
MDNAVACQDVSLRHCNAIHGDAGAVLHNQERLIKDGPDYTLALWNHVGSKHAFDDVHLEYLSARLKISQEYVEQLGLFGKQRAEGIVGWTEQGEGSIGSHQRCHFIVNFHQGQQVVESGRRIRNVQYLLSEPSWRNYVVNSMDDGWIVRGDVLGNDHAAAIHCDVSLKQAKDEFETAGRFNSFIGGDHVGRHDIIQDDVRKKNVLQMRLVFVAGEVADKIAVEFFECGVDGCEQGEIGRAVHRVQQIGLVKQTRENRKVEVGIVGNGFRNGRLRIGHGALHRRHGNGCHQGPADRGEAVAVAAAAPSNEFHGRAYVCAEENF